MSILRRLLEVVSQHTLIAQVVGGIAAAAAVAIVLVTSLGGPSGHIRRRRLLEVVSQHKLITLVAGGIAAAAAVAIVLVTSLGGPPGPKSRYGDPALDALVAVPEQLYSPPNPLESSRDAAKRVEPLITTELFKAMSVPPERQSNYKMGLVAEQHGTVTARAYIDDHGVRDGADTKTSVSRTVIVIQQISFPDGRKIEDKFGLLVDAVLIDGKWKANKIAPEPALDVLNGPQAPVQAPALPPVQTPAQVPPAQAPPRASAQPRVQTPAQPPVQTPAQVPPAQVPPVQAPAQVPEPVGPAPKQVPADSVPPVQAPAQVPDPVGPAPNQVPADSAPPVQAPAQAPDPVGPAPQQVPADPVPAQKACDPTVDICVR